MLLFAVTTAKKSWQTRVEVGETKLGNAHEFQVSIPTSQEELVNNQTTVTVHCKIIKIYLQVTN